MTTSTPVTPVAAAPTSRRGPWPGLLGDVVALHGRTYAEGWNFPTSFEAKVATEMAEFFCRYDPARDLVLSVAAPDGRASASITLDVSDPELAPGQGHVRWFIVADQWRGRGVGRQLIDEAIAHARRLPLASLYLTTFRGLDAAATLYQRAGFAITHEQAGATWGRTVVEQRLELAL